MKVLPIILAAIILTAVGSAFYYHFWISISACAVLTAGIILSLRMQDSLPVHRFVVIPGYLPGTSEWLTAHKLVQLYGIERDYYVVYDPLRYPHLEFSDIVLVPLEEGTDYIEFKEELVRHFYDQRGVKAYYEADLEQNLYIYGT